MEKLVEESKESETVPVNEEELNNIKQDLLKACSAENKDEHKLLSLIKLIRTKRITLALLSATKIGKVFTKIVQLSSIED